ncbi:thioredoxin family protein [Pedobacter panaciterrae]
MSLELRAQEKGVNFEVDLTWEQVKAKAFDTKKYIFIDVFATWCGPCKWLDKNVYESSKVGEFVNENFISVKLQGDVTGADSERVKSWYATASEIMKTYKVRSYPTFLFFSPQGKLVDKFTTGAVADTTFIAIAKNALNPEKQYVTNLEEYKAGKLPFGRMQELAITASQNKETDVAKLVSNDYINNYLFRLKQEQLFTWDNLTFMSQYLNNVNSKAFVLFLKDPDKVNLILGKDRAQYALRDVISKAYFEGIDPIKKPNFDWTTLNKTMKSKFGEIGMETLYGKQMIYYLDAKDWVNFGKYYTLYFEKALKRPEYEINNITWPLFENVTDSKVLKFACDVVMKYAVEEWYQNDPISWDTYANLLYKTGKKEQAIAWEEKAVKQSNQDNVFVETLGKMRKNINTWPDAAAKP